MSYEFTKLGAVEALTEMPENANALVEVDGAIKRVPASAASGGGSASAGGSGAFVVTFTVSGSSSDSDGDIYNDPTCDKTSAEIVEAYEAGIPVVGYLDGASGGVMVVHLTNVDHSMLTFVGTRTYFDDRGGCFIKSLSAVLIRMHDNVVDAARTYTILS